jgi:hypothetical protein
MSSRISAAAFASAFVSILDENMNDVTYINLFNPTYHKSDLNHTFLKSQAYKEWNSKEKNEWKRAVVAELKKNGITIIGEPSGTPAIASAIASASAPTPVPASASGSAKSTKKPAPPGITRGKGKAVNLATLIAKLMEANLSPADAASCAQSIMTFLSCE